MRNRSGMLAAISRALEERDQTQGHGARVAALAEPVVHRLGWEAERIAALRFGALHHDIGKIAVRRDLLRKSGPLTLDELAEIRTHPSKGAELVRPLRTARHALPYVLCHHERWDGDGYPSRIRGDAIPIEAPPARRRRRVRRDDLTEAVPPGAHARARAARVVLVRRHAVRPGDHGALPRRVERGGRRVAGRAVAS